MSLFVAILSGCGKKTPPYVPRFEPGMTAIWEATVRLTVASGGAGASAAQEPLPWSEQSLRMRLTVDSLEPAPLADSAAGLEGARVPRQVAAWVRLTLDTVIFKSVERDSFENVFLGAHLKPYRARFRLSPDGAMDSWSEEPALPDLGPGWLSPAWLVAWVWPTWPLGAGASASHAKPNSPSEGINSLQIVLPVPACRWHRSQHLLTSPQDTSAWAMEWNLEPAFDSTADKACLDLAWRGVARMRGERVGFGLKDFKWQAQAQADSLVLTRDIHVARLIDRR